MAVSALVPCRRVMGCQVEPDWCSAVRRLVRRAPHVGMRLELGALPRRAAERMCALTRVVLQGLSFGFSTPLFERVSLDFDVGWTGLIGANGSGKTTLLRLIAGELLPSEGSSRVVPGGEVVWCRQQSLDRVLELERFSLDSSKAALRWRGLLGLPDAQRGRFETLSAGERKRWQLALELASDPAVLLMDEPTNHLDSEARQVVCDALLAFRGVGILVSHDRALLDRVTTRTGRIRASKVELCPGNFGAAEAEWQARQRRVSSAKEVLTQTRRRIAERVDQQKRRAASAERDRSTRRRMKDKNDHDARGMLAKNRAEMAGKRLARDASALESRLGRVEQELSGLFEDKRLGRDLFADYAPWPKPLILRVAFDALQAGPRRLLGQTALDIARTDKICLVGPNGSGKTSLLRELARQNPRAWSQSVHLPQSLAPDAQRGLAAALLGLPALERGRVLGFVAALGSEPDAVLASPAWSPGELRKVLLGLGLARHAPALILDEPTNHFDLPSIERIERLLSLFPGCVVLITHDERLAERVATRALAIERGELVERRVG